MLVFDKFPERKNAVAFAADVERTFNLSAQVFDSQDESNAVDPFPFALTPPIVLVERGDDERAVEAYVEKYHGAFAGT